MSYDLAVWEGPRPDGAAAEERYPEDDVDPDASVWAVWPLMGNAVGDGILLPMTYPGARAARDAVAGIAATHGLVCFDPQTEELLT